jgi:hypothetical protein
VAEWTLGGSGADGDERPEAGFDGARARDRGAHRQGYTNLQIARELNLNHQTVKNKLTVIYNKTGVIPRSTGRRSPGCRGSRAR